MNLVSQTTVDGMQKRQYLDATGATLTTLEVPTEVIGVIGPKRLKEALARAERMLDRRRKHAQATSLLKQGWKPAAVASEVGISDSMAFQLKAKI